MRLIDAEVLIERVKEAGKRLIDEGYNGADVADFVAEIVNAIKELPSEQPKLPPYVVEIEAEYQKAVNQPHIHKPLAKALYEVWKKHDREDARRNG